MTGCYLTSLAFQFMRAAADFDPAWPGAYFIPRMTMKPPSSLLVQIWPELNQWLVARIRTLSPQRRCR